MPEKPLISIITVNLNDVEGLKRTMTSVFEQTWQEFEYIVIDGDSTDGSKEYIESHKDKIDYWVSEQDSGIYNAMNKGIKAATGEYLLFLNSGDHFYNELVLEQNYTCIKDYDLVYFNINVIEDKNEYIRYFPEHLVFSYFIKFTLPHQATFIKSSLFEKVGYYDESLKIVSDWKFFVESICIFNASYFKIEKVLSTHYLNGISTNPENWHIVLEERKKILEAGFNAFIEDSNQLYEYRQELAEKRTLISNLRKSRKIRLLVKLGLLNKF